MTQQEIRQDWQAYQEQYPDCAQAIKAEFADRAITEGWRMARDWFCRTIANELGESFDDVPRRDSRD